jgi:macrolide-specific efflux system membrane fusion protein
MRRNKMKLFFGILIVAALAVFFFGRIKGKGQSSDIIKEVAPSLGSIQTYVSTTGTVYPKNRLEVIPPVAGRIESIQVKEGDKVKDGQTLAWMSSTERAALLDAAQGQGEETVKYWENVYKPIALLAPIDGEVIVATTQPGATVTSSTAVVVLSDHLIVRAQVDETDIGKIKLGQPAYISLDAYPDKKINGIVDHIYYESETVNNVTIYKVDLVPENVPEFFRSGMNATIDFIVESRQNALLLPVSAVRPENGENYVLLSQGGSNLPVKRLVKLGITDDKNYEILSGLSSEDAVLVTTQKYVLSEASTASNPFMPKMSSSKKKNSGGGMP